MGKEYKLRMLVRRTLSISIGQRPMRADRHISACINLITLSPFQGLPMICFRFIGRCPMLLIQGLRP